MHKDEGSKGLESYEYSLLHAGGQEGKKTVKTSKAVRSLGPGALLRARP